MSALKCHGLSTIWVSLGAVLPPPDVVTLVVYLPPQDWLGTLSPTVNSASAAPLDPPPRA